MNARVLSRLCRPGHPARLGATSSRAAAAIWCSCVPMVTHPPHPAPTCWRSYSARTRPSGCGATSGPGPDERHQAGPPIISSTISTATAVVVRRQRRHTSIVAGSLAQHHTTIDREHLPGDEAVLNEVDVGGGDLLDGSL